MASVPVDDGAARWPRALSTRATRERGRRTLTRLLDAAVEELAAHGYRGARVSQVAKRAGVLVRGQWLPEADIQARLEKIAESAK